MKKLKVMTIVGTRPELIKLSAVIVELDKQVDHVFVHTGQNYDYELNEIFFKDLGLRKPDHFLEAAGQSAAETIGKVIIEVDKVLEKVQPEALLLLGDTNSCLAVIPAKRRKIPIFHMEAGNRCFDQRVPEELNRKIVDHLSDINMPYTDHARRYLLAEGLPAETIIKTGSPMAEIFSIHQNAIDTSDVLSRLELEARNFFVVSAHREENVDTQENLEAILDSLNAICEQYNFPIIVSTHPRTRKRLDELAGTVKINPLIQFIKPLGFFDYVRLQKDAYCTVSDSGTITEESNILNFPAVTIRQAHERPEGMDEAAVIMCGLKRDRVLQAIEVAADQWSASRTFDLVADYAPENVSKKVLRIILSYVDYVRRTVWRENV